MPSEWMTDARPGRFEVSRRRWAIRGSWRRFCAESEGATALEYGLLAAMFAIVGLLAARQLGGEMSAMYNDISSAVTTAGS